MIPAELGNLTKLEGLYLYDNQLSGGIPHELGNLINLKSLYLSYNHLTGDLPVQLENLTNLTRLGLNRNQLTGSVPAGLGNLSGLKTLLLSDNGLTGTIPTELGYLTSLERLNLSDNLLSGSIPLGLGNLTNAYLLNLSNNMLSGNVPASFENLVNLCEASNQGYPCDGQDGLDLGYNHLNVPAPEPPADFLELKDPNWYLTQAIQENISGDTGAVIISYDENTEIVIPQDAFTGTATFLFDPQPSPSQETGNLEFAGNSFELTAWIDSDPLTTFDEPLVFTIRYDENSLGGIAEDSLNLYYWDEDQSGWLDAVTTCEDGTYTRNLAEDWVSLQICHLSEFAFLGDAPINNVYLPLILK